MNLLIETSERQLFTQIKLRYFCREKKFSIVQKKEKKYGKLIEILKKHYEPRSLWATG